MIENEKEHVALAIAGRPLEVVGLSGRESVSRLFRFDITCRAEAGEASPDSLVAAEAAITIYDRLGAERRLTGLCTDAAERIADDGSAELSVTIRPHAYVLSLGRSCRIFQHKTVVDIVKEILARSAQKTRWEVVASYKPHEYCAQYREDDWTFAVRMLEEEGIYFWFEHDGPATTLVFSDRSTIAPDLNGGADVVFAPQGGMGAESETIDHLGTTMEAVPGKFSITSFNHQKPLLKVSGGVGDGDLEIYDAPGGGPDSPEASARRAKLLQEAAIARSAGVVGTSTSVRLVPGMVLNVVDSPLEGNSRYLITRVSYRVAQRRRGAVGIEKPYACEFEGIAQGVPFRPQAEMPSAVQTGLQTGKVVGAAGDEVMPDATGRVRVQHHWDRDGGWNDQAGKWMRVAQRGTEESMLLPRVGWNVLTFNEEGEIDAPSVLSRIHDAEHPPTYALPGNKTRVVFKTATTPGGGSFNEIYFEDKKGGEEVFMNASKDMIVYAQQVKAESVKRDSTRAVGVNHALTVGSDWTESILHNQQVAIGGNEQITVGNGRLKEVKQNETVSVGGMRSITAGYQHTIAVGKRRNLKVGAASIEITTGSMSTVAGENFTALIGGVDMKVSQNSVSEDVGKIATQVVGGARIEISGLDMPADTGKTYKETVAGAMCLKAGGAFIDGATKTSKWVIGAALDAVAPEVYVEAVDKIELKVGSTVITILPDSVEIASPSFDLSGAELKVETQKVEHN